MRVRRYFSRAGARSLVAWLPVLPGAAYLLVLSSRLHSLIQDLTWISDWLSPMVLGSTLTALPAHAEVHLGAEGNYHWLWFDALTRGLPGHRYLWELSPLLVAAMNVGVLAWCSWRAAGRWAAMLTGVIGIAVSPAVLLSDLAQADRVTTWLSMSLLALLLLLLSDPSLRNTAAAAWCAVVVAVVGIDLASDPLLLFAGLVPFGLVSACAWLSGERGRRVAIWGLATAAATVVMALAIWVAATSAGLHPVPPELRFATQDQLSHNVALLISGALAICNGTFLGRPLNGSSTAAAICALIFVAGVWVFAVTLRRTARTHLCLTSTGTALLTAYWGASALLVVSAFVFSTVPVEGSAVRYLTPLVFALAAVLPLALRFNRRQRAFAALGVSFVAVMSTRNVDAAGRDHDFRVGQAATLVAVAAVLDSHGLHRGYASYWDANPITFHSQGKLQVHPVWQGASCRSRDPGQLCAFNVNSNSTWYLPQQGVSSFVIQNPPSSYVAVQPSPRFGPPRAVYRVGGASIFVYDYDVASRFSG